MAIVVEDEVGKVDRHQYIFVEFSKNIPLYGKLDTFVGLLNERQHILLYI